MRFVSNDPYALRGAVERLAGEQPIVDVLMEKPELLRSK
jgi:hypothetical protein